MNILVTGVSGFLGRSLSESEHFKNHSVFNTAHIDLTQPESVQKISDQLKAKNIDTCFHFAGVTPFNKEPDQIDFSKDSQMAENVTKICRQLNIRQLVYTSGWIVYSNNSQIPINETASLSPSTKYGQSKLRVEKYFKSNLQKTTLINLRLASVYGPGQKTSKGLIPNLVKSGFQSDTLHINSVKTKRDYIYIDDVIELCSNILSYDGKSDDVNIGSGHSHSVLEIAEMVKKIFQIHYNRELTIKINEPVTEADPIDNRLDITKAKKLLHFENKISFTDGLLWYIQWMETNQA